MSRVPLVEETGRLRRLLLVGSILVDVLVYVDILPERGSDTVARGSLISSGGGFNVLAAAARLGLPGAYAGRIGAGTFGRRVARDLEVEGIAALLPPNAGGDTGFDVVMVEAGGERSFLTAPGVEACLRLEDLARLSPEPGDVIYVSGYDLSYASSGPTLDAWLAERASGNLLVVDPGPLAAEKPGMGLAGVLPRVGLLSCNAREARLLSGREHPGEAAKALTDLVAPGAAVVVRVGGDGCWVATTARGSAPVGVELPGRSRSAVAVVHVAGRPATATDTTGAGDVHVGAMLARMAGGDDLLEAARTANLAASLSVMRPGGAAGPSMAELTATRLAWRGAG